MCDNAQGFLECIVVEQPFERVGIDILGPFPRSVGGNKEGGVEVEIQDS